MGNYLEHTCSVNAWSRGSTGESVSQRLLWTSLRKIPSGSFNRRVYGQEFNGLPCGRAVATVAYLHSSCGVWGFMGWVRCYARQVSMPSKLKVPEEVENYKQWQRWQSLGSNMGKVQFVLKMEAEVKWNCMILTIPSWTGYKSLNSQNSVYNVCLCNLILLGRKSWLLTMLITPKRIIWCKWIC